MAKGMRNCRVCGKLYEGCKTVNHYNVFRWQDVACSPECGEEYLRRIRLSREEVVEQEDEVVSEPELELEVIDTDDSYDFDDDQEDEYDEDFSDDE